MLPNDSGPVHLLKSDNQGTKSHTIVNSAVRRADGLILIKALKQYKPEFRDALEAVGNS
jgi:hypothetical protein